MLHFRSRRGRKRSLSDPPSPQPGPWGRTLRAGAAGLLALAAAAPLSGVFLAFDPATSALAAVGVTRYVGTTNAGDAGDCTIEATPCATITYAIGQAADGDTINVAAGTYAGSVVVNKDVTLLGVPGSSAGADANAPQITGLVTLSAAGATLQGFKVTNPSGSQGVLVTAAGATVDNNTVSQIGTTSGNSPWAIYVKGVSNATITDNVVDTVGRAGDLDGSTAGIYVERNSSATMSDIVITGNSVSNVGASDNADSNQGIWLGDSSAAHNITGVTVAGNTVNNVVTASNKGAYGITFN